MYFCTAKERLSFIRLYLIIIEPELYMIGVGAGGEEHSSIRGSPNSVDERHSELNEAFAHNILYQA